jgi:hypothetical protein
LLVNVERSYIANSYEPFVPIPNITLAGHVLSPDKPFKSLFRKHPAKLLFALPGLAGLLHLRGVDAVEPDLGIAMWMVSQSMMRALPVTSALAGSANPIITATIIYLIMLEL